MTISSITFLTTLSSESIFELYKVSRSSSANVNEHTLNERMAAGINKDKFDINNAYSIDIRIVQMLR